jgi:4-carboxymuconolactone decarboxylase
MGAQAGRPRWAPPVVRRRLRTHAGFLIHIPDYGIVVIQCLKPRFVCNSVPSGDEPPMSSDGHRESPGSRYEEGLRVRSEVLGAEHVKRSLESASEFSRPIQELVTEYCWGTIWARPGLARRDRSLINLGMLTALGRSHELGVHVRGAVVNGCTKREIQEVLLQATIYCGVPAGMEAFRVVESVIEALEHDGAIVATGEAPAAAVGEDRNASPGPEPEEHQGAGGQA